jgi:sarcosine oxidase
LANGSYDVIVIGVGGMGSATVYQLAVRGKRVLGIERFGIPHEWGSSHGLTRIIRLAFYEGPEYVPLGRRAYQLWHELEGRLGEQIFHVTGSVHAGPPGSLDFDQTLKSCIAQDVPHEVLTSAELTSRWPGYRLPSDAMAVVQADGGFLIPERCIEGYVAVAREKGAEVHEHERVLGWEATRKGVRVVTDQGEYEAGELVVTAGAWAGSLLPQLQQSLVPERQVIAWFEPRKPALFEPESFPVFTMSADEGHFYGFPAHGTPGFKMGKFLHEGNSADPDNLDGVVHDADTDGLRAFTEHNFPDAAGPLIKATTCMFTYSPDEHFVIGIHKNFPQVSFAVGFSGHGFKFCSTVGEIMADLAESGGTAHDISLFDPRRLEGSSA